MFFLSAWVSERAVKLLQSPHGFTAHFFFALPLPRSLEQRKLPATDTFIDHTSLEASNMVAICDLSPHSAKKVRVNAWRRMGDIMPKNFFWLFPPRIMPVSTSWVIASVSFSNYKKISTFEGEFFLMACLKRMATKIHKDLIKIIIIIIIVAWDSLQMPELFHYFKNSLVLSRTCVQNNSVGIYFRILPWHLSTKSHRKNGKPGIIRQKHP